MMTRGSDERTLATWLAGRSTASLSALFAARGVSPAATWQDFFDAAAGLLDAASIDRALIRMPRTALAALAIAVDEPTAEPELRELGLVCVEGEPFRAVRSRVLSLRELHPDAFVASPASPAAVTADTAAEASAAERTFASAAALADVLLVASRAPLARTAAGTVVAADRKRLVEDGAVADAEELDDLLAAADAAGLVCAVDREWLVTPGGSTWLAASTAARWERIAQGFADALPAALRATGVGGADAWPAVYPLDPDWPARAARLRRIAEAWGLVTHDGAQTSWGATLQRRADAAALAALLPPEIDRIYLQADLSAIAPGPLLPALDLRLRTIAVRESRAQASTYRFTAESLAAGMAEGETAESVRAFLEELSLTGIPQPLLYLIETTASRHGRVRVSAALGRARVESDDAALIATIEVDQALRPLGLVRDGDALVSRVSRDTAYWALADARYPVIAVDAIDGAVPLHRGRLAVHAPSPADDVYAPLIARLREASDTDAEAAWRERELDQAVRTRAVISVMVRLPDGQHREFVLEATGLGGGRLRGRDRGADIERTLPISSIESVHPV